MHLLALITLSVSTLALLAKAADDIEENEIPRQCRSVCEPIVSLTAQCDAQHDDSDRAYFDCVCQASNAGSDIPSCEACVSAFDDDGSDNDVNDLLRSCGLSTTTYNSASTSSSPTSATSGSSGASAQSTASNASGGATTSTSTSTVRATGASATASSASGTASAENAAATAGPVGGMLTGAAMGVAALGVLGGAVML